MDREQKIEGKKILVAGDAMLDIYHFGRVDRISPEAPVPVFLETGKERHVPGGAANVAVNIAATGAKVEFLSVVGEDIHGQKLLECLSSYGVGVKNVAVSPERGTSVKLRYMGPGNQQLLRVDREDVHGLPAPLAKGLLESLKEGIPAYGAVVLSDYRKGFLEGGMAQRLISLANSHGIPVLVDVKGSDISKYKNATLLKPNRKELRALTGKDTDTNEAAAAAASALCRCAGCRYVLATLGAGGMLLADANGLVKEVRSTASEVYDVTGAGDTSIAYLAAGMAEGKTAADAMVVANYAAGVQVSKVGTGIVRPEEVCAVMQDGRKMERGKLLDFYREGGMLPLREEKASGRKVVFTNGCFDILHAGHVSYLREAAKLGDILVVGVNSDQSVSRLKGKGRPVTPLFDRAFLLSALEFVDYVVPFEEDTPKDLIAAVAPDILVKGGDYRASEIVGADFVLGHGGEVRVLPFVSGKSTTAVIQKIQEG